MCGLNFCRRVRQANSTPDAAIIASVKNSYHRSLLLRLFDKTDCKRKTVYNVDALTAMQWTVSKWEACAAEIIRGRFLHCINQESDRRVDVDVSGGREETRMQMEHKATENGLSFIRVRMEALLHSDEEDDFVELISSKDLSRSAAGAGNVVVSEPEPDGLLRSEYLYSVVEELKGLPLTNATFDWIGLLRADQFTKLRGCQRELRAQKIAEQKQTTIKDHFKTG